MFNYNDIIIIIPALNEELNISATLTEIRQACGGVDVLVIDDGSTDQTAQRVRHTGASVLSLPVNLGIGGAVQAGFIYALRSGYQYVVRMDADGQHKAEDVETIVCALKGNQADLVVGSRFNDNAGFQAIGLRKLGIHVIAWMCRILNDGVRIKDPTSGFRGYSKKALVLFEKRYPSDYPEPEELIMAANGHCLIMEVPVTMAPRLHGKSSIGGWISFFYMLKVLLAAFIEKTRGKHGN